MLTKTLARLAQFLCAVGVITVSSCTQTSRPPFVTAQDCFGNPGAYADCDRSGGDDSNGSD